MSLNHKRRTAPPHDPSTGRSHTFHTVALAVSAAHRFASPSKAPPDVESSAASTSPLPPSSRSGSQLRRRNLNYSQERYHWVSSGPSGGGIGDEPGVDVRSRRDELAYGHLKGSATITVYDYSPDTEHTDVKVSFPGDRLKEWFETDGKKRLLGEDGKPKGVRWIHVEGMNWEVIKELTLEYGLHPLSVEDALRATDSPRSKLDFYQNHLYLQILVQHTHQSDGAILSTAADEMASSHMIRDELTGNPRTLTKLPEGIEGVFEPSVGGTRLQRGKSPYHKEAHRLTVDELSAKYMVPVRRSMLSLFMTRDGTVITLTRKRMSEVLSPIYERLEDDQSLLRRSGDSSMLAEGILDVSVDLAVEISQTFEAEILNLEASVLVDPQMATVRHLHVLSSQLIRLRKSIAPLLRVTHIIRDQDAQRSQAASAMATHGRHDLHHRDTHWLAAGGLTSPGAISPGVESVKSWLPGIGSESDSPSGNHKQAEGQGFFSPMTKVYIGDVTDHLETVVSSMDQFVATCDHLTDYVFNMLSFQTNASMERLSIVTVVFLPLTFIASYFGMNFTGFEQLNGPVSYFWKIAAPCTVGFFVVFSFTYLRSGLETTARRLGRWRRTRMVVRGAARAAAR
ncbi:MAG: hypothetical protein TREMPRED_002905 [Tremellales sp. Tagirdzhanova-0007]|nr:MAG: hypothetical protein TREMPRED_002905 [Tremellales sp. Tagirdzhanova-0007]